MLNHRSASARLNLVFPIRETCLNSRSLRSLVVSEPDVGTIHNTWLGSSSNNNLSTARVSPTHRRTHNWVGRGQFEWNFLYDASLPSWRRHFWQKVPKNSRGGQWCITKWHLKCDFTSNSHTPHVLPCLLFFWSWFGSWASRLRFWLSAGSGWATPRCSS